MDHYYNGTGWESAGPIFGLLHLLVLLLVILFVFRMFSRHGHHRGWHRDQSDPLQIAKTRYAKGEITKTELEEIKKNLT